MSELLSLPADQTRRNLLLIAAEWERSYAEDISQALLPDGSPAASRVNTSSLVQVSRIVSVAELFTYETIISAVERHVLKVDDPMLSALYKEKRGSIDNSWASIERCAREWLLIDLSQAPNYSDVMAYVDVRNAAMHGAGSLTRRQERNRREVIARLNSVGIAIDVNRLVASNDVVRNAALACHNFVGGVDRLTWLPPHPR